MLQNKLPVTIGDDLSISINSGGARLTPAQGLRLAEQLIRKSTHSMIIEEAERARRAPAPHGTRRRGRGAR
jgi:hypothetical protein